MENKNSQHSCMGCGSCGRFQDSSSAISGFRLVLSAFVVFVIPVVLAIIGGSVGERYFSGEWSVVATAFAGGIGGVMVAVIIVKLMRVEDKSEDE